jgi:hypothetical protein
MLLLEWNRFCLEGDVQNSSIISLSKIATVPSLARSKRASGVTRFFDDTVG